MQMYVLIVQKYQMSLFLFFIFRYTDMYYVYFAFILKQNVKIFVRVLFMKTTNKTYLNNLFLTCNNQRTSYQTSYFRAWLKYKSDNIFVAGPVVIIPILALIFVCLILIFSSLYLWSGETNTYSQSLWETFMRTLG